MNPIQHITQRGQSIWCDNLGRGMIDSGELRRLIDLGVAGVTSNPTIFMKSITGGSDYDEKLAGLIDDNKDVNECYEGLVIPDIVDACDAFLPLFERTGGRDGFVSLEVSPKLAHRTRETVEEARRLHRAVHRPNLLIKVPATGEGIPAIATLIGEGISVNVTLIFSIGMYRSVIQAYLDGLHALAARGGMLSTVASVASFFVSRVDTLVDKQLEKLKAEGRKVDHLLGRAAVANAKLAYARFLEVFDRKGPFGALAAKGARVQRPLWASTSTKNPNYSPTMYVDPLIGPDTVNTLPPQTIEAVLSGKGATGSISDGLDDARFVMAELGNLGVDMQLVTSQLLSEGVAMFAESFEQLLGNLASKRRQLRPVIG